MPNTTSSRLSLLAYLLALAACLATSFTAPPPRVLPGEGDLALYQAITSRVRSGQSYYPAAHVELLSRHYGLQSVLNWRTPTLTWISASLPQNGAKILLLTLSLSLLILATWQVKQQAGTSAACLLALFLPGALLPAALGQTHLFSELWAGQLILLSILLYPRLPILSVLIAVGGLFLRELTGLYLLLLLLYTLHDTRLRKPAPWLLLAGLAAYALFFSWHIHQVHAHLLPTDPAYPTGWIQFGGLPFLLATSRQNTWLLLLPKWLTALYLPTAILGLFLPPGVTPQRSCRISPLLRPTLLAYLALFAIVGKPFNDYWGLLISPLLALSFAYALPTLPRLLRAAV